MKSKTHNFNFKDLKVKQKMVVFGIFTSVVAVILSGIGIGNMINNMTTGAQTQQRMNSMSDIADTMQNVLSVQSLGNAIALNTKDPAEMDKLSQSLTQCNNEYKKLHDKLMQTVFTDEYRTRLTNARKLYESSYEPAVSKSISLAKSGDADGANAALASADELGDKILSEYSAFKTTRTQNANTTYQAERTADYASLVAMIIVTILAILAIVLFCRIVMVSINRPMEELEKCADGLQAGDLTVRSNYQSQDELGVVSTALNQSFASLQKVILEVQTVLNGITSGKLNQERVREFHGDFHEISDSLNRIIDSFNEVFSSILKSANQVDSGSSEVSNGAESLAQGATEQASAVQELSSTIDEVSVRVHKNSDSIAAIASEMYKTADMAKTGETQMGNMLDAMNQISASAEEIGKIIGVINNIAFQTNILAINASVEAAHAGQAGKGFAVVADEVRNLANKSSDAAKQTASLIENSNTQVQKGLSLASDTAHALNDITAHIQKISDGAHNIETASNEQAQSIAQITTGIDQVSAVIQTNSATAEQSAAASAELSKESSNLKKRVNWIQLRAENQK